MGWTKSQYEDRIRSHLGDLGILQRIPDTAIPLNFEAALSTFTKDRPRHATGTISGDGTATSFTVTGLTGWNAGWSRIVSIEYPLAQVPRRYVDDHDWLEEDGTVYFTAAPDAGTDNLRVRFTSAWPHPDADPDTDVIPEIYAHAICELAAAKITRAKANEYARQQSTSVGGELFPRDATALFDAARELENQYKNTVLGRPDTEGAATPVAMAVSDVDVFPASIFHRRSEYISDEGYGG